jgi:hypothetical protein
LIALLPATVIAAPSRLHGTDQNEEAENGCKLSKDFNRNGHAVMEGTTRKGGEYQDWKSGPD